MEYLVTMATHVPDGTPEQAVDDVRAREAEPSRELATEGQLLRLWRPLLLPGEWRPLGLRIHSPGLPCDADQPAGPSSGRTPIRHHLIPAAVSSLLLAGRR
jgi:hypothetical protein